MKRECILLIFAPLTYALRMNKEMRNFPEDYDSSDLFKVEEHSTQEIMRKLTAYEDEQINRAITYITDVFQKKRPQFRQSMYLQPPHTGTVTTLSSLYGATGKKPEHDHRTFLARLNGLKHAANQSEWEAFDEMVSFTFVRDPWSRVLSCASWVGAIDGGMSDHHRTKDEEILVFRRFVKSLQENQKCGYLGQQYDYVYAQRPGETEKRQQLTFVGRTQHLQKDFNKVCELLGLPHFDVNTVVQHCVSSCPEAGHRKINASATLRHRDVKEYYDDETMNVVAKMWHTDIQHFGFKFGM